MFLLLACAFNNAGVFSSHNNITASFCSALYTWLLWWPGHGGFMERIICDNYLLITIKLSHVSIPIFTCYCVRSHLILAPIPLLGSGCSFLWEILCLMQRVSTVLPNERFLRCMLLWVYLFRRLALIVHGHCYLTCTYIYAYSAQV